MTVILASPYHYATEVTGLELSDGEVDGLDEVAAHALAEEGIEVEGAAQQLHMALLQDGHVTVGGWVRELVGAALCTEPLVHDDTAEERGGKGEKQRGRESGEEERVRRETGREGEENSHIGI